MGLLLQLKNKIFLTIDIDWAPDQMVNHVIDLCLTHCVKATFFATHASPTLARLRQYPDQFEVGLHPNFLPGSTQGGSYEEIFEYCKRLAPNAISIRTHSVYQHGRLYNLFNQHFGTRVIDSSICMPGLDNIQPFELYTASGCIVRVPFFWADDYYLLGKQKLDPISLMKFNGCKVYMFHPIHIYQNTRNIQQYERYKNNRHLKIKDVSQKSEGGIGFFFERFLQNITLYFSTALMQEFYKFNLKEISNNERHSKLV